MVNTGDYNREELLDREDEAFVKEICSIAEKNLPDYDEEQIYEEWKQNCV